jgi:hypothetical protein
MGEELKGVERRGFLAAIGAAAATPRSPIKDARPGYIWVEIPVDAWRGLLSAARTLETHRRE